MQHRRAKGLRSGHRAGQHRLTPPAEGHLFHYLGGGFVFGIALFRANVLPRWSAALLAVGTESTIAIPLLPQVNERLFAIPTVVALVGLGYSLWRECSAPRRPAHAQPGQLAARPGPCQVTINPGNPPRPSRLSGRRSAGMFARSAP